MISHDLNLMTLIISIFGRDRIYKDIDPKKLQLRTCIVDSSLLLPHEDVERDRLEVVAKDVERSGYVKYPVVVDLRTFIILDGHHRVRALSELGFRYVPTFFVDYAEEYVDVRPFRKDIRVSKYSVVHKVYGEKGIYPPKTTRHVFKGIIIPASYVPLGILKRGDEGLNYLPKISDIVCFY